MEVCLESYLLVNIIMNALMLDLASRALGRRHPARIVLAAVLGGVWAVAIYLPGCGWLGSLPLRIFIPALMAWLACGTGGLRDLASCAAAVMCMTMLLGGGALMISLVSGGWGWGQLGWCCVAGGALGLWLTSARLKRCWGWETGITLERGGRSCRFTALVDTGNRLREPVSGACVLIVSQRALRAVLPDGFNAADTCLPDRGWRMVYYTALGEQGFLKCFRPGRAAIQAGRMRMERNDFWVAVYPGDLPGGAQALCPLELSCSADSGSKGGEYNDAGYTGKI